MNLGCGQHKLPGFINVDSEARANPDQVVDLCGVWPWSRDSVDEVMASHLLEHLPPGAPFFRFMRELYRVCKPGAQVTIVLPHPSHDMFLGDPTHLQAVMPGTIVMFSKKQVARLAAMGDKLTPFCDYLGVDFDIETVHYSFDQSVSKDDPELEWKAKHLRNIITEWRTTLTVVK